MSCNKYHLVLASQSPRRKDLLSSLGIPFKVLISNIKEESFKTSPSEYAVEIALLKANDVYSRSQRNQSVVNPFIIASDTIVTKNGKIYGKPKDINHAREILMELSDSKHEVITAVGIIYFDSVKNILIEKSFFVSTEVIFEKIDPFLLENYLKSKDSLDKAGAYGVQGSAQAFIIKIIGSYSNVVGLPISNLVANIKNIVLKDKNTDQAWNSYFFQE